MKLIPLAAAVVAAAAFAQQPPAPDASALKAYLGLTDSQVTALQAIRTQQRTALADARQQLQQKQQALNSLLSGGSTDAGAVGKLVLDIQALRKQLDTNSASLRAQAANVLTTADQKTKLKALEDASKLQPVIREAEYLFLLAPPTPAPGSMVGPGGFGFGGPGGPGFRGGRGPAMFGRQ
jgi:Spy/CpxP family protein refolding chaperone